MSTEQTGASGQPSEEEMRAAYEAELNRITSGEMILQTAVSLLNIGGRRLGLGSPPTGPPTGPPGAGERDLEQVADAIDGARALMPILERRMPGGELGPLRDAIAQLQVAYAREVQGARDAASATTTTQASSTATPPVQSTEKPESTGQPAATEKPEQPPTGEDQQGPGPAQASGRLWVPGR